MKQKITFLIAAFFTASIAMAQNQAFGHLTIFSEDGDKFFLILNGERINDVAQTNLRVEDLTQPHYNAKIIFEDASKMEISKNFLQITDVDGIFQDVTYKIKRDKNNAKKMKLNFYSAIDVDRGFIPPSNVHVMHYGQPVAPISTVTQTTTTTSTGGIHAGVNVGGVGVNVSIHEPVGTVTYTTTTSSTHSSSESVAPAGCLNGRSMTPNNFNSALQNVKNQNFDDTKLKVARQIAQVNCLSSSQIVAVCKTFGFDDSKLEFAKSAYEACTDPANYFKVNEVFQFSSNVDALTDYIANR